MATKLLHLTTCPNCREGGSEIRLDLDRLASLHECYEDDVLRADLAPDLNPFVLSSDQRDSGPCKHLGFLSCIFCYMERAKRKTRSCKTWDFTCEWWHSTVGQLDDDQQCFVVRLTDDVGLLPGGDVPFGTERFSREWPDQERMGWPSRRYSVAGEVVFCRDAGALFEEIGEKWDWYTSWWTGEDRLGTGLLVAGYPAFQFGGPFPRGNPC